MEEKENPCQLWLREEVKVSYTVSQLNPEALLKSGFVYSDPNFLSIMIS